MLNPVRTTQFKRDSKLAEKRGKKMSKLKDIMVKLINEKLLQMMWRYILTAYIILPPTIKNRILYANSDS